ncbi:hypothetical protein SB769_37935, partial [Burkholderia sp. SIMBA_024]
VCWKAARNSSGAMPAPDRVARFLLGIPHLNPGIELTPTETPDGIALLATLNGRTDSVVSFAVARDRITEIFIVRNPDKLTQWQ